MVADLCGPRVRDRTSRAVAKVVVVARAGAGRVPAGQVKLDPCCGVEELCTQDKPTEDAQQEQSSGQL